MIVRNKAVSILLGLGLCTMFTGAALSSSCENMAAVPLSQGEITSADVVAEGLFHVPDDHPIGYMAGQDYPVPEFCRVQGVARPTADSEIKFEVWLPIDWNGRYYQVGMGGSAGSMQYSSLSMLVATGAAVATTNTGHEAAILDWSWAAGHPEKIVDFGYRAHQETSEKARKIIQAYYHKKQDHAYFTGCSRGGHSGMISARRNPEDWDGILIGAAGFGSLVEHLRTYIWRSRLWATYPEGRIPEDKWPAITRTTLASCRPEAHLVDGLPADPRHCSFDPDIMLCNGAETKDCLTQPQADMLKRAYAGPYHSDETGAKYPGFPPTFEIGGPFWTEARGHGFVSQFFGSFAFNNPNWTQEGMKPEEALTLAPNIMVAGEHLDDVLSAEMPQWSTLKKQGSKVIIYHGWSDKSPSALLSLQTYGKVVDEVGGRKEADEFMRLFMVPGMSHCVAGPGANAFGQFQGTPALTNDPGHDVHRALETWVEAGVAPEQIIATKYVEDDPEKGVAFTRPLCPYPQVAKYNGTGSTKEAMNYRCEDNPEPIK